MWSNGYNREEPDRVSKYAMFKPEAKDRIKWRMTQLWMWITSHKLWIAFIAVCVLAFFIVNGVENQNRLRPSVGGELFILALPVVVRLLLKDEKDGDR